MITMFLGVSNGRGDSSYDDGA